MRITQKANLALSLVAFGVFVVNVWFQLTGSPLDFHGIIGATVLAGFLALGVIIQCGKLVEGHRVWWEFVLTLIQLGVHVYAELTIWIRTQITGEGLPPGLPLLIVGLYWVVGVVDILAMNAGREMKLFGAGYTSPEIKLAAMITDAALDKQKLADTTAALDEARRRITEIEAERGKAFELFCDAPGCDYSTGLRLTHEQAARSLSAHKSRTH